MDEPEIDYIDNDTTCSICFAEFLDLEDLEIHRSQVHTIGILNCQFCALKQRSIENYAVHIRDEHLMNMKLCQYCTRVFVDEKCYMRHEKKHRIPNTAKYSCSQCEMQFNNTVELEKHEFNTHKDGDASKGQFLQDSLPHLSSVLNMSLKDVLLEGKSSFTCAKCRATTLSLEDYIQHLKNENCRSVCCNTCFKVYTYKKSLWRHFSASNCEKNHTLKTCAECLQDFPAHFRRNHQKSCKAVKCQICHIVFEKMDDLAKHQTEKHPIVMSVQVCKFCQREFVGKVGLDKHIERTHKIEQYKYKCVYCQMVFKHPQKLFAHFFMKHKEIEPYFCNLCNKKFRIRKTFTVHIKLEHNSIGSVEFDEKFHVYFKEKKSKTDKSLANNNSSDSTQIDENNAENSKHEDTNGSHENRSESADKTLIKVEKENDPHPEALKAEEPTEIESITIVRPKRKVTSTRLNETDSTGSDSSDDQPLLILRNKKVAEKRVRLSKIKKQCVKSRFTCNYCLKICKTYQNYHHHMNTEHQNESVKCVKCHRVYASRKKLSAHIAKQHSSSKLTETLKKVLAKRKNNQKSFPTSDVNNTLSLTEKFQRTIKKVDCPHFEKPATLKSVSKELSVQKFIENFTPETNESKKNIIVNCNVTIKPVICQPQPSLIKLTKFQRKATDTNIFRSKLAMPVRFKPDNSEPNNVTIRVVNAERRTSFPEQSRNDSYYDKNDNFEHYAEGMEDSNDNIPDVGHEVMLEESEEAPKPVVHKVVIPNIPKEMGQVRIATLLPEAPYYKIIKISEVLKGQSSSSQENKEVDKERDITLPNGKKLVSVNPLAHLLGNTPIEKIMGENKHSKYYQPKMFDFETAVAKALMGVRTPSRPPKKKTKITKVEP